MTDAPRDDLIRSVPFELVREDEHSDGLTLEGYAAVFNEWTEINSWEGHFEERIMPGAFKKSLSERTPVLQFDHGSHPLIGSIPVGVITTIREDKRGLFVRARMSDNWLVQPIRDAIRDGAIHGMSFRFSVPSGKDKWDETHTPPRRSVYEVISKELGPVVFPAYEKTTVSVRSRDLVTQLVRADEDTRVEVARVLTFGERDSLRVEDDGTSTDESRHEAADEGEPPAAEGTGDDGTSNQEAAVTDQVETREEPAEGHSSTPTEVPRAQRESMTDEERQQALAQVKAALEREPV